jgi:hypothetical protein
MTGAMLSIAANNSLRPADDMTLESSKNSTVQFTMRTPLIDPSHSRERLAQACPRRRQAFRKVFVRFWNSRRHFKGKNAGPYRPVHIGLRIIDAFGSHLGGGLVNKHREQYAWR